MSVRKECVFGALALRNILNMVACKDLGDLGRLPAAKGKTDYRWAFVIAVPTGIKHRR